MGLNLKIFNLDNSDQVCAAKPLKAGFGLAVLYENVIQIGSKK